MNDVSRIRIKLAKDMKEWVQRRKSLLLEAANADIQDWLPKQTIDTDVKQIASYFWDISLWYAGSYAASGIGDMPNRAFLALSTRAAIPGFLFEIPVYGYLPGNLGRYDFDEYGKLIAQVLTTGWRDQAELVARQGFKELNRLMDRGISYGRLAWFMLELTKDWLKADVSLDSEFRAHEVEDLGIWDKLLTGWRDKNTDRFDALMSEMADYHVLQSKGAVGENDWYEFESMAYWLFPVELLAVLRLREWEGIPNPPLSHPIFTVTPLAKLYPPPAWPKDEILDKAEAKFRSFYPDTPSVADLPALRKEQGGA